MSTAHDPNVLPADLPVPHDDGAARHLAGLALPSVTLAATDGSRVDLSKLSGRTVVYAYPRTGVPGRAMPEGWDQIPGARGCTPQSCAFRDHFAQLTQLVEPVGGCYNLSRFLSSPIVLTNRHLDSARRRALAELAAQELDGLLCRATWPKDLPNANSLAGLNVLRGNDPASPDDHVVGPTPP